MNFKDTIETLAANQWQLDLSLGQAVTIANLLSVEDEPKVYRADLSTHEKRVEFAKSVPEIVEIFKSGNNRIQAIKALRAASEGADVLRPADRVGNVPSCLGLKDAKDAIDALWAGGILD